MMNKNYGFTLIELAMVLFILALMLGSFLTPLATSLEQRDREKTSNLLEEIRENLIGYALVNGHFPCPDCATAGITANCASAALTVNDGIEDGVDAGGGISPRAGNTYDSCATLAGNLPWVTLGVPENDAWGNHFVYQIRGTFSDDVDGTVDGIGVPECTNPAAGVSFCLASTGDIDINDAAAVPVAEDVSAVVVSIGNNSDVAFANLSAAEQENLDNFNGSYPDTTFVSNNYIQTTGSEFDDLLIWVSPPSLMYQMVKAERLP